jgi:ComF family protein
VAVFGRVVFSSTFDQPTASEPASTVGRIRQQALHALEHSAASIFSALFPAECRICGELLVNISRLPVCAECLAAVQTFDRAQCQICGEILLGQAVVGAEPWCGLCQRARPTYERAFAFGPYEGVLRDLIHLLKYHGILPATQTLGRLASPALKTAVEAAGQDALLIPVPLFKGKARQRTFNQAEEIARAALKAARSAIRIEPGFLERVRETKSQTGLTRHQRRENVRGAFSVPGRHRRTVRGKNIILLDDVFTTGTTAEECARVLKRAGAAQVWVVTVARVS